MTAVSKNVYFDALDDIVNKYNNTVHRTIKMKPMDVTSECYAENNEDSNVTKPKFKAGNHVCDMMWHEHQIMNINICHDNITATNF